MVARAQRAVLELVPGITDPASIKYRNEAELLAGSDDPIETIASATAFLEGDG